MASQYRSPFTVGKRQTVYIDSDDPRVQGFKANITAARLGSELVVSDSRINTINQSGRLSNIGSSSSKQTSGGINPKSENFTKPSAISNLAASWQVTNGDDVLAITWDFDANLVENEYVAAFSIKFVKTSNSLSYITKSYDINKTSLPQSYNLTSERNGILFGPFTTDITSISVAAEDSYGNIGEYVTIPGPVYNSGLTAPTITVTSIQNGYTVNVTNTASQPASLDLISIEEYVSNASTEPTGVTYTQVSLGSKTVNPVNITTSTTAKRWVKARFTNASGVYGPYSTAQAVTPTPVVVIDNTPPNEVTAVSAAWSGDNIVISYTLPGTDPGVRFQVALTAPNSSVGYFYVFPVGGSSNQTATLTKADLFNQFGSHYSSYSGVFKSIDSADNRSDGVSFSVAQRANPLLGVTPTFSTTALVNGYSVSFTLPAFAQYAKIYQKYTSWSGVTPYDSFTGSYASGGASGTNTVTLSGVVSDEGTTVTPLIGYRVVGTGIPNNTYITNVVGNQITVNNNFTSQVSGSVTGYGIVYSGVGPATITSTIYTNTFLLVRYYDDFENPSNYSAEQVVVPLSPTTVDTTGPGNVATVNTPTSGIDQTGNFGFNGFINLSWNSVTDSTLRGYRIRYTTDTSNPVYSFVDFPIDQTNPPTGTISYKLIGLAVGATYKISIATYDDFNNNSTSYVSFADTTISGIPSVSSYISTTNGFQIGAGVGGGSNQGIYLNANNYWYLTSASSASLRVGGSNTVTQNTSGLTASGQALVLLSSATGVLVGQTVTGSASIPGGTTVTRIVGNTITLSNNLTNTIANGTTLTFSGVFTGLSWNGSNFSVDGDINARGGSFAGNIALSTPGASIYSGTLTTAGALSGDGFIFNRNGLIIRQGTNQVSLDTATGGITANNGNIADWVISASKIEKLDPSTGKYAGLSSTGTYKFWAGSTAAGGDTTQFAVNGAGKVWAQDIQISGGSLDIGAAAPNGFHVQASTGNLTAGNATLSGAITATSGKITGSFQVDTTGVFYAGAASSGNTPRVAISYNGLSAFDANNNQTTSIAANAANGAATFTTDAAKIGGWYVNNASIKNSASPSTNGTFSINSSGSIIILDSLTPSYRISFNSPSSANDASAEILTAGTWNNSTSQYIAKNFALTANGTLTVQNANVNGVITATSGDFDGALTIAGGTMKIGKSAGGGTNHGIYIGANDYWYADKTFSLGGGILNGTATSVVFELNNGINNITFNNMPSTDFNGWAGDPTVTIDDTTKKLVKGRRLIYNSLYTGTGGPGTVTNFSNETKTGKYFTGDGAGGSIQRDIKSGDLVFIQEA